jgi:hypothetical protein
MGTPILYAGDTTLRRTVLDPIGAFDNKFWSPLDLIVDPANVLTHYS